MRRRTYLVVGATTVTGTLAGCLGGDTDGDGGAATTADSETAATAEGSTVPSADESSSAEETDTGTAADGDATVTVNSSDQFGEYLTDAEGMALYLFTNDEGGESTCYDGCAATWPPLTVDGTPTAGDGVTAELGTTEREDGSMQVIADEWPLYYYTPDESPGETNGQGVGGVWFLVTPDGSAIESTDKTATGTEDSNASATDGAGTSDDATEERSDDGGYQY